MTIVDELPTPTGVLIDLAPNSEERRALARVSMGVSELGRGGAVLLCDDAEQPDRADLLFAAMHADRHLTAFAIAHTSGFLQVALPSTRCDELDLVPQRGADRPGLRHCVTVDAAEGIGTGISAADRATTARLLASSNATAAAFTRPGHVVPLRAEMGLPRRQHGFAEAAVDLISTARLTPAAMLATVVGLIDATSMAAGEDVRTFAAQHNLPCIGLSDLAVDAPPPLSFQLPLQLAGVRAQLTAFTDDVDYLCLVVGEVRNRTAVPLHLTTADRIVEDVDAPGAGPCIIVAMRGHHASHLTARTAASITDRVHTPASALRVMLRRTGARSLTLGRDLESWFQRA
ncbi:3,4-dihydroxy-2-butanone 4-phosphate synthase [Rhodococcus sp. ACS1]|uniref:3,4-dihydroxy-2-butanone-4-phosphate synthase n=1 Tax=Rhodococcus sp. ACS1 TaxID=2028570 RepID=UPI000BB1385E|nr:3,4-dihydroxy-2-butanone-4-phosphate synthase [Rhodococcus sp. ACS1]PBC36801.1 3,4-dihydroxy-2-butanone 4-phosphate synthase [Rhodococcus sp. ACS1]